MIGKLKVFAICIGAITVMEMLADGSESGDALSNKSIYLTNASNGIPASEDVINSAYYDFYIPPSEDLPPGSIVKIKSISFSGFNNSYQTSKNGNIWADSAFVRLNGVRSNPVNGGSVPSSQYSDGTWGEKIASGEGVEGTLLKYEFSSDCLIVVGKLYSATSSGNVGEVGNGITLLHANGRANGRGGNDFVSATAVRFVKSDDANSVISYGASMGAGLYPVYEIEAELQTESAFWVGGGADNKFSNPNNWSTGEMPQSGNVGVDSSKGDITIELDCELSIESLVVSGSGTVVFAGSGDGSFTADNFVVGAPVVVNCSNFHPRSIEFVNNGSISIGEQGRLTDAVFSYTGSLPNIGTAFTPTSIDSDVVNPERWGGVIWLRGVSVSDFNPNGYGHGGTESLPASTVRLSGVRGYFPRQLTVNPVVELKNDGYDYGMNVNNGYSRRADSKDNIIEIEKLIGDGALWTSDSNAKTVLLNIKEYKDFLGSVQLVKQIVVFGDNVPEVEEFNIEGSIYIGRGIETSIPVSAQWRADGGIHVEGTLNVTDAVDARIRSGTQVVTYDTGVVKLTAVSGARWDFNYSRIQGSGSLCFAGTSWCSLTTNGTISTSLVLKNEQPGGLVVPPYTLLADGGKNYVCEIGSLSGSGAIRGDYNWVTWENAIRSLRIKQSADTVWTGIVGVGSERIGEISVATGESRAGTLTLAGEAQNAVPLTVEEGAKVRITGAWKGSVDVNGTIGGTGKVEGTVSFADGSSLVVSSAEDLEDPLEVSSATFAGTVTIELPEGSTGGKVLRATGEITNTNNSAQFVVKTGGKVRSGITASIKSEAGGGSVVRVNLKRFVIRIR